MNAPPNGLVDKEEARGRRAFFGTLGGLSLAWLGSLVYPVFRYLSPPAAADLFGKTGKMKVDKITPADVARPGQGKNGGYGGRGLIVLRTPSGELLAFDAKCTHAGCNVSFEGPRLHCPCHGGTYDLHGRNISGPPPRPLTELAVSEENGELFVSKLNTEKRG